MHRRRTEREAKAKVVASVWRSKCIQFLAALSISYLIRFGRNGWIQPFLSTRPSQNTEDSVARNGINFAPQSDAFCSKTSSILRPLPLLLFPSLFFGYYSLCLLYMTKQLLSTTICSMAMKVYKKLTSRIVWSLGIICFHPWKKFLFLNCYYLFG